VTPRYFLLAVGILLGGCFRSEQPKFPLANAAAPFGDGGRYVVYAYVDGSRYDRQEIFVLKRRPDGAYDFTNEAGKTIAISLHGIGDGRFAGQAISGKDGNAGYAYTVFQVTNQEAVLYLPKCDEQDKAMIAAFNVEMIGQFECVIDRVRDPVQLFGRLSLGKPISKLVRE
jgi:hypothetical protein